MSRGRKLVAIIFGVLLALPICFVSSLNVSNFYARWQAGRLLKALRTMQPGVTSEKEYMAALSSFRWEGQALRESDGSKEFEVKGSLYIMNDPECRPWNYSWCEALEGRLIPYGTDFGVVPTFANGVLNEISFREMQIHPIHCCEASATRHAVVWKGREFSPRPFNGYSLTYADSSVWNVSVDLDQRASPEQLERALDFDFRCFTRLQPCEEAKDFLQPVPDPSNPDSSRADH